MIAKGANPYAYGMNQPQQIGSSLQNIGMGQPSPFGMNQSQPNQIPGTELLPDFQTLLAYYQRMLPPIPPPGAMQQAPPQQPQGQPQGQPPQQPVPPMQPPQQQMAPPPMMPPANPYA